MPYSEALRNFLWSASLSETAYSFSPQQPCWALLGLLGFLAALALLGSLYLTCSLGRSAVAPLSFELTQLQGSFWGLAWMSSPLFLSLAALVTIIYCLRHFLRVIWFFIVRDLYGVPSYAAFLHYKRRRLGAWLWRIPHGFLLGRKTKAYRGRRYYFLFVWFFFSFFFRLLTLLLRFFFRWSLRRFRSLCGFPMVRSLSFPLASWYPLLWQTYSSSWRSLRASLGLQFFLFYLSLRRHLYYLSINEYVYGLQDLFREKNPASQEKRGFYDSHAREWNFASASPLRISLWRPAIISLFPRLFPLTMQVSSIFLCVQLLWLSWMVKLLFEIACSFLTLPFLWAVSCLNVVGSLHLQRFTWLSRVHQDSLTGLQKLKALLLGGILLLTFALARIGRFAQRLFLQGLLWRLYLTLWALLLVSVQLPAYGVRGLLACMRFVVQRSPYFLLLLLCLVLGGQLFAVLAAWLSQLLYDVPGWLLAPWEDFTVVLQSWQERAVRAMWHWGRGYLYLGKVHASQLHWNRWYIKLQTKSSLLQPRALWLQMVHWGNSYTKRKDYPALHSKKLLCFFGGKLEYSIHVKSYSRVYVLFRLLHRNFSKADYPALWVRDASLFWGIWSWVHYRWLFLEYPLLVLSKVSLSLWGHYYPFFLKLLNLPVLGFIAAFYAAYYSFLQSLPGRFVSSLPTVSLEVPPVVLLVCHQLFLLYEQSLLVFYNLCLCLWEIALHCAIHLRQALQESSSKGSISSWYGGLLLDLLAQQWLLWPRHFFQHESWEWYWVRLLCFPFEDFALALLCTFFEVLGAFVAILVPEQRLTLPWLASVYLSFWAACERTWDTFNIYWQLSKLPWKSTGDYASHNRITQNRKSRWLMGKRCDRESWFSAYHYGNPAVWNYLSLCCSDLRAPLGYGAEVHRGFSPRYLTFIAFYQEGRWFLIFRLIKQSFIMAPWVNKLGFFPLYDRGPGTLENALAQYVRWPFFGPFFYYAVLLCLMLFWRSFRLTFCLPTFAFEEGANKPWKLFRQSTDMAWAERLVIPRVPAEPFYVEYTQGWADWARNFSRLELFLWWRDLRAENQASYAWQKPYAKQSVKDLWHHLPSLAARAFTSKARRLLHRWQRRLALDYLLSPIGSGRHSLSLIRSIPLFSDLYRLVTLLPNKTRLLFRVLRQEPDYNFRAANANSFWDEIEELRAEHLYRADRVKQRLRSWRKEGALVNLLNQRLFGHSLDKESSYIEWAIIEPSALLAEEHRRLRFSPLFYSKVIHEQSHLFVVPSDPKIAAPFAFWFLVFPFMLFFQGFLYHYCLKHGWSPRKGRQIGGEYMILLFSLLLHWAPWADYYSFVWSYSSTTAHIIRAGSRFAVDDPGRWQGLAPESLHRFYYWPWLRHLRNSDSAFYPASTLFTRKLFPYDNLSELRFFGACFALWQLLLVSIVIIRCLRAKPRFFSLRNKVAISSPLVMFAQQSSLKHSKLRLKQGLLRVWLKA